MEFCVLDSKGVISNILCFDSYEAAESFNVVPSYKGAKIGDVYDETKVIPPEPKPTLELLAQENKLLKAQLKAQTERSDFIEDCIAEMATQVYGGV